jgi:hypothetical protein
MYNDAIDIVVALPTHPVGVGGWRKKKRDGAPLNVNSPSIPMPECMVGARENIYEVFYKIYF